MGKVIAVAVTTFPDLLRHLLMEGAGIDWPGTDLAIVGLVVLYGAPALGYLFFVGPALQARRTPATTAAR